MHAEVENARGDQLSQSPSMRRCLWIASVTMLCSALCSTTASSRDSTDDEFSAEWKHGNSAIKVRIEAGKFVPAEHEIKVINGEKWVDGQRAVGIDGTGGIETEIKLFTVTWNDKPVPIPKAAYATLFNFSLKKASFFPGEAGELVAVESSREDALLFIFARGADSVSEWVWLVVSRDGKWFRFEGADGKSPLGRAETGPSGSQKGSVLKIGTGSASG